MKVALNALCIDNKSGTGRYAYGLIDGFLQANIPDTSLHVFIPSSFKIPDKWKHSYQIRFYPIPAATSLHRIYWEQFKLPKRLKALNIKTLHSPAFISPCLFQNDLNHLVTIHDLAFLNHPNTIPMRRRIYLQYMIRRSINQSHAIIADSNSIADEIRQEYTLAVPIHTIHLGVEVTRFSSLKQIEDQDILDRYNIISPYFLFVGTIEPRKNLETVLSAFSFAKQNGLVKQLVIVGRYGWMVDENLLKQSGVNWIGHIPEAYLPVIYRNADALLAPSLYEGFDLPTVEALACGTHVIASDIPVHREILREWATYIPANDVDAWANALLAYEINQIDEYKPRSWVDTANDTANIYKHF